MSPAQTVELLHDPRQSRARAAPLAGPDRIWPTLTAASRFWPLLGAVGRADSGPIRPHAGARGAYNHAMSLDPDVEEMRRLGYLAVDRAVAHLAGLRERRVVTPPRADELRALVDEPLPRAGHGLAESIDRYFDRILPRATLVNHPRFFAYVPGPGSFAGAVGAWLAAATNTFVGTWLGGSVMAQLELLTLDWLRQLLGLPPTFQAGILTSGGSMANLGALAAARARAVRAGHRVADLRVYLSQETHYSMAKAGQVLGLPADAMVSVPVDRHQRMRPDLLAALMAQDRGAGLVPLLVCATAGTTSTGAVDPIAACADLARQHGAWLHVDAAYGAGLALLPEHHELRAQLALADSITLDPHKWLYCPFESGCLLTTREDDLRAAFTADGAYLQDIPRDEVNFFERGPELSRGNRALKLWLLLRSVGADAIAAAVARDVALCRLAHELLRADPRIHIVTPPQASVFTFAVEGGDDAGRALIQRILEDGFLMLSSSRVDGRFVLRFCVVNHRTTEQDVRASVARIHALLDS